MLPILIYSEYIATKKCKECQLLQLFCSAVASSQEIQKLLHGNGEQGKVLLLVGLPTLVNKITASSRDVQDFPLLLCPFPRAVMPLLNFIKFSFSLCLSSKLEGLGWQGWSPPVFLLLPLLLSFVPATLSPALMSPWRVGKADGRKMQSLETLGLPAPISL